MHQIKGKHSETNLKKHNIITNNLKSLTSFTGMHPILNID